jgi:hypothetical protein
MKKNTIDDWLTFIVIQDRVMVVRKRGLLTELGLGGVVGDNDKRHMHHHRGSSTVANLTSDLLTLS